MALENNPIFRLCKEVIEGRRSLEQALDEVVSVGFQKRVNEGHCEEMVQAIPDEYSGEARIYSYLSVHCAECIKVEECLLAKANLVHGDVLRESGNYHKALEHLNAARIIFDKKGMWADVAECDNIIALVFRNSGKYDKALELFQSLRKMFYKKDMAEKVALCDNNIASVIWELGQYEKAIEVFQSARIIFDQSDMTVDSARCGFNMASVYRDMGQYERAIELFQSARRVFDEKGIQTNVAKCDMNMARVYDELCQYERSMELFQSARKIFDDNAMTVDVAWCDVNIGNVQWDLGRYNEAIGLYQSARKIFDDNAMIDDLAKCDGNMAVMFLDIGQYAKSLELFQSVRKIFDKNAMVVDIAMCDMNMGLVLSDLGQYDKALSLYQSAIKIFDEKGSQTNIARCTTSMAEALRSLGQFDRAIELFRFARKIYAEKGMQGHNVECDMNIGIVLSNLGQHDKAIELFQSARKVFDEKGMMRRISECDIGMARVYENLGKYEDALALFRNVSETCSHLLTLKWQSCYGMGRVFRSQGIFEKARPFYGAAIDVIENMRKSISRVELRTSFLTTVYDVYYEMVDLCIEQKDFKAALEYVERLKSRNLSEFLADHDLVPKNASEEERRKYKDLRFKMRAYAYRLSKEEDDGTRAGVSKEDLDRLEEKHEKMVQHFRKRNVRFDPDQKVRISYPEIRDLVCDGESALIELFPMEDRTVAFVVLRDGRIEESTVAIPDYNSSNLISHISGLRDRYEAYQKSDHLQKEESRKRWEDYLDDILMELYKKMFLRIKPYIEDVSRIVMSPYSGFHLLPLHAMFAEEHGHRRYLIDDYMVTYSRSAKVLKYCKDRERKKRERLVVALANPKATNILKFAWNEAEAIKRLFDGSRLLSSATREDIINYGRDAHIFHYTGHASYKALMLHSEKGDGIKQEYHLEDLFVSLDLPDAYLATLSACETGVTELGKLDEYIGLTSGFLHAGAATVISSLWSVSDICTTLLMKKMYELIKKGKGKAMALREAQLWLKNPDNAQEHKAMLPEMRKDSESEQISTDQSRFDVEIVDSVEPLPDDMSHPYYWAGFICSGVE